MKISTEESRKQYWKRFTKDKFEKTDSPWFKCVSIIMIILVKLEHSFSSKKHSYKFLFPLQNMMEQTVFGYVKCDLIAPDEFKSNFFSSSSFLFTKNKLPELILGHV